MSNFKMDDYVPVNERIEAFYAKWPDGTIQSEIVELTESRVTVKAYAYRQPDDARPGIGHSSLEIPGKSNFTLGSEIENAETSAWGRAIAALGFEVKRGVSSREEVRNKQPERGERAPASGDAKPATTSAPVQRSPEEQALIGELLDIPGMTVARMTLLADAVGIPKGTQANADQLREMLARTIEQPSNGVPTVPAGGGDGSSALPAADNATSDAGTSDAATPAEVDSPLPQPVAPNDLMDDILTVTDGEEVHPAEEAIAYANRTAKGTDVTPEPGTLESAIARAEAKAAKAKVRA